MDNLLKKTIKHRMIYLMLLPGLIYYVVFAYVPMYGVQIAFKDFNFMSGFWGSPWNDFFNFELLFKDQVFWNAVRNTVVISTLKIVITFPIPIILAILLNELGGKRLKRLLQTIFTIPHFLSWVIISGILFNLLSNQGVVNSIFSSVGLPIQSFLGDTWWFRIIIYVSEIWKEAGWGSIIFLAAIAGVSSELYEAATVDGANRLRRIWHITLPGIRPTIVLLLILAVGNIMNANFDQIFNLYNPAVYNVSDIIDTYVYRVTFGNMGSTDFGYSAASGLFKSVINFTLLIAADRISKRFNQQGLF